MNNMDCDIRADNSGWSFDGISGQFEDHIEKSVPYYRECHELAAGLSDFFVYDGARVLEIGTSTGALLRSIADRHPKKKIDFHGIDLVESMITEAEEKTSDARISFECCDFFGYPIKNCSLILSFYTAQFIRPAQRQTYFNKIFEALDWGGALILFEKVRAPDARFQDYLMQMYNDFKLTRGFDPDSIINKSRSLKGVLEPFSEAANIDMLKRAGFADIVSVYKWICFEGFIAIK